jgi:hypothetical protein
MEGQPNQVQQVLVPVTRERFSELSGLELNIVESMVRNRSIPTIKIGKHVLVNVPQLYEVCMDQEYFQ